MVSRAGIEPATLCSKSICPSGRPTMTYYQHCRCASARPSPWREVTARPVEPKYGWIPRHWI